MMRLNTILFIISGALAQPQVKDNAYNWKEQCAPIQAYVHEPLRCRESDNAERTEFKIDDDCCAGSDKSPVPALCANGFNKTEKGLCAQDHDWCRDHECRYYTCEKSTSCLDYVGCFQDEWDAREFRFQAKALRPHSEHDERTRLLHSVSACVNFCRNEKYSYAALQGAGTCFCGDSYGKYGRAAGRVCGEKAGKAVALRCGDGDEGTCAGANAVYRVAGDQPCCEYFEVPHAESSIGWIFGLIGPIFAAFFILLCCVAPTLIGLCIWLCLRKKHKERQAQRQAQRNRTHIAEAERAASSSAAGAQPAVAVTVLDPATQKTNATVAAPVMASSVVVASAQPAVVVANGQPAVAVASAQPAVVVANGQPAVAVASAQPTSIYPTV